MKFDELIGSLLNSEMAIVEKAKQNSKGVVFQVDAEDCDDQVDHDVDENFIESIAMLANIFSKVMRILDRISGNNVSTNVKDNQQQNSKGGNFQRRGKDGGKQNKAKGI